MTVEGSSSTMAVDWRESDGAKRRVISLLQQSGALLEEQVAALCEQFVNDNRKKEVLVSTESITYGDDTTESPLRQIDQRLNLYKEFILDERTGVQWQTSIPIEVKYRADVEVVGVNYPPKSYRPRIPITSSFQGSRLSQRLRLSLFDDLPLVQPVFLKIEQGTPREVHKENLVHNAAGALYDFVRFDLKENENSKDEQKIISDLRLLTRFDSYLRKRRYAWWSVLYKWMAENLTDTLAREFNRRLGQGRVYYGVEAQVPTLCVNGPIWHYKPPDFTISDTLLTRVRVPQWPGALRRSLIGYTTEAPLLLTNTQGLRTLLDMCLAWFYRVESALKRANTATLLRWPIESTFYKAVVTKYSSEYPGSEVRSDIDVFDWL
jgi:hypothetical protein